MQPDFVSRKLLNAALELFDKHDFADVEPRQIAEAAGCSLDELYTRIPRKQASEGKISREEATQKIVEMQQASTMAHIEKSVKEGKTTRAEADSLLKKLGYK